MKKVIRLTESDLNELVNRSAERILKEHMNSEREIQLAYKEVQQMGKHLSSLGLRLEDTRFRLLFQDVKDSITALNNAMIKHLREQ